jgi:hypothetical protein
MSPPPASPTSCGSDTPPRGHTQRPGKAGSAGASELAERFHASRALPGMDN